MRAGAIKPPSVHYSPSQCTTYKSCERKWGFDSVFGYREEEGDAAAWGTAGHSISESLLKGETPKPPDPRFQGVLMRMTRYYDELLAPFLAKHGRPQLHVEHQITAPFDLDGVGRFWWTFLDLTFQASGVFEDETYDAVVLDHKTTKSLEWAKTRWELAQDIQMLTCAYHAPVKADRYLLVLGQVQREGPVAHQLTSCVVTRDVVVHTWNERVLPQVREMERARRAASYPGDLEAALGGPGRASACKAFGGCPYLEACKLAHMGRSDWDVPIAHLRKHTEEETVPSFLNPTTGERFVPTKDAREIVRVPDEVLGFTLLKANPVDTVFQFEGLTMPSFLNPPDSTRRPEGSPWHVILNEEEKLKTALEASVAPKEPAVNFLDELMNKAASAEALKPAAPAPTAPTPGPSALDSLFGPVPKAAIPEGEVTGPIQPGKGPFGMPAPEPVAETKPKKGGRPKGSKNKSTTKQTVGELIGEPVGPTANGEVVDLEPMPPIIDEDAPPPSEFAAEKGLPPVVDPRVYGAGGCTLFVDCAPFEGWAEFENIVHFSEFIAPVLAELSTLKIDGQGRPDPEKGFLWPDWRMIPYGQGASYIRKALADVELPPALVVETRNPLVNEVLDTLRIRASRVVQGFGR